MRLWRGIQHPAENVILALFFYIQYLFYIGGVAMSSIMPAFNNFPKEGEMIGRLLTGYGELELGLCGCVAAARGDFDMVFKAMFRPRGETQRIQIADAMGRVPFNQLGHATLFNETVAAVLYCLKIRNQYAHCYWTDNYGQKLGFVQLEETAIKNSRVEALYRIKPRDIDLALLQAQEKYFVHTRQCLNFLMSEVGVAVAESAKNPFSKPRKVTRPPLYKK